MFKRIDTEVEDDVEGFSYSNVHNEIEFVKICNCTVKLTDGVDDMSEVYYEDIPKLIKALEAAYKHKGG